MNKHWKMKDGKIVRRPRYPVAERNTADTSHGLTLETTVTKSFTFTVEQLKRAATADKLTGVPFTRDQIKTLIISVIKENRWALFENLIDPYKVVFNGYGQFKYVEMSDGTKHMNAAQVFHILDMCYYNACN